MAARRSRRDVSFVLSAVDRISRTVRTVNTRVGSMLGPVQRLRRSIARLGQTEAFQRLRSSVGRLGGQLRRFGIAGVVGLTAAAEAARRFVGVGDSIAKTADAIGISTDALQELTFAGDRQGTSSDLMARGLQDFSKRLGEAKSGTGALFTLLKKSNPELLRQLVRSESLEESFGLYADAVAETEDATVRAALANAAFGRAGKTLVNTLRIGKDGVEALRQEARDLGFVLDEETARRAEIAQDRITDLTAAIRGMALQVGSALLPVMQETLEGLVQWARENRTLLLQDIPAHARSLAEGIRSVLQVVREVVPPVVRFVESIGGARTVLTIVAGLLAAKLTVALWGVFAALAAIQAIPMVAALSLMVGSLVALSTVVMRHWEPIKQFFQDLADFFEEKILGSEFGRFLGIDDTERNASASGTPQAPLTGLGALSGQGIVPGAQRVDGEIKVRVDVAGEGRARIEGVKAGRSGIDVAADVGSADPSAALL